MKYMLLLYNDPETFPAPGTPEGDAANARWFQLTEEMAQAGVLAGGEALQPPQTATVLRAPNGSAVLSDGPYAETKEFLGGYYVLDVPDFDAAAEWAAKLPNAAAGATEIRPVVEFPQP